MYHNNNEAEGKYLSLVLAIFIFIGSLALVAISIISYIRDTKKHDEKRKYIFMEFYEGVKPNRRAKLYTTILLIRRTLFVTIIIFFSSFSSFLTFTLLLVIQLAYVIQFAVIRPLQEISANIAEFVNEFFIFIFTCLFMSFQKEEDWNNPARLAFLILITMNTLIITIITYGKGIKCLLIIVTFIIELYKKIKAWRMRNKVHKIKKLENSQRITVSLSLSLTIYRLTRLQKMKH